MVMASSLPKGYQKKCAGCAVYGMRNVSGRLASAGIQISMDGRGRALDNVFVERLWRTVKYEEVYVKD